MYDGAFPCSDLHKEPPNLESRKTSASLSYNGNDFAIFLQLPGLRNFVGMLLLWLVLLVFPSLTTALAVI